MNSLLEYGSSSSDSETEDKEDTPNEIEKPASTNKLPKPEFGGTQSTVNNSVFVNPFVQEELAKSAILEKHVKMVPTKGQLQTINGKRICWSYRRGRCRFGHNCKFAHDSDVQKISEDTESDKQIPDGIASEGAITHSISSQPFTLEEASETSDDRWEGECKPRLKRPGLTQGLVPGKKVMRMYQMNKASAQKK